MAQPRQSFEGMGMRGSVIPSRRQRERTEIADEDTAFLKLSAATSIGSS
jgi:hypothetical protein